MIVINKILLTNASSKKTHKSSEGCNPEIGTTIAVTLYFQASGATAWMTGLRTWNSWEPESRISEISVHFQMTKHLYVDVAKDN